jgi:YidC/Oxa1 family membrane protein insertase
VGLFEIFSASLTGFYALIPSYGLSIILLTLAVRVVLLPLSIKQTRSMREMQRIQPEVKRIQAKHKGDRQKMNEEMMALYKEHGVNPFGGCAPLLLQFPLLIGLFYVVRTPLSYMGYAAPSGKAPAGIVYAPADFVARNVSGFLETLQHSRLAEDLIAHATRVYDFLGLHLNCSANGILRPPSPTTLDSITPATRELAESCGSGFLAALPYLALVLFMGFTTWYQQKQMQANADPNNPQAAQMQMFAKIMPVMLMFFAFSFPTGVVLYWLTTNVWTIAQQRIILRAVPHNAAPSTPKDPKPTPAPDGPDGDPTEPKPKPPGTANRSKKKKR